MHLSDAMHMINRNNPKFSDPQVWENSVDPDQAAPEGQSDQCLHCLPLVCIF